MEGKQVEIQVLDIGSRWVGLGQENPPTSSSF